MLLFEPKRAQVVTREDRGGQGLLVHPPPSACKDQGVWQSCPASLRGTWQGLALDLQAQIPSLTPRNLEPRLLAEPTGRKK